MPSSNYSFAVVRSLILVLGATCANLLFASATWGQSLSVTAPPLQNFSAVAVDANFKSLMLQIAASSQNEFTVEERPSTRAADLLPAQSESTPMNAASSPPNSVTQPQQSGAQLKIPLSQGSFAFGFGSLLPEPTTLQGPSRRRAVSTIGKTSSVISLNAYLRQMLEDNQFLLLQMTADPQRLGLDLSYTLAPKSLPGAFSANLFNQRSLIPVFEGGDREVDLPNGKTPWVHRLGGGIEYSQTIAPNLNAALGLNYQRVSVRDAAFTSDIDPVDELGNRVTFSNTGQDDLLTLNFSALYSTVDDLNYPTRGSRVKFGIDQSIPVGAASILFSRLSADFTQFIPLNFFGSSKDPDHLVFNLQGGTTIGDVPPYEAFTLGGSDTVRGYNSGEVSSSRSYIEVTTEYRFPMFSFSALKKVFKQPIDVGGVVFVDYGTALGTQDEVTGEPAVVRDKPGEGLGYGLGLYARTTLGRFRLEFGWNDQGDSVLHFDVGDRF